MPAKLAVRNFKRFGEVGIGLGNPIMFRSPDNAGKTSAVQAREPCAAEKMHAVYGPT